MYGNVDGGCNYADDADPTHGVASKANRALVFWMFYVEYLRLRIRAMASVTQTLNNDGFVPGEGEPTPTQFNECQIKDGHGLKPAANTRNSFVICIRASTPPPPIHSTATHHEETFIFLSVAKRIAR